MSIHVDVYTRLHDREIRRDAQQLERTFDQTGRNMGNNLSAGVDRATPKIGANLAKVEKATDKVADAMGRVQVEQAKLNDLTAKGDAPRARMVAQSEALARAKRAESAAVRDAARAHADFGRDVDNTVSRMTTLNTSLSLLGKAGGSFAMAGLVPGLAVAAGAATAAAGALALLPGAAAAAGAAFGTLALGVSGFGDAMKSIRDPEKFAESLQSLSPNAQQAALSIRSLLPQFDKLKNATQDSLFAGVSGQLQQLSKTLLPTVEKMTTGVAGAFNDMFMGVTDQLMSPKGQAAFENITANITKSFEAFAPAMAPLTQAFTDIMSVGSDVLPNLATAAAEGARAFADFISKAQQSGQLKQWLTDGLAVMKELGSIVVEAGRAIAALAPVAKDVLPYISDALGSIADLLREHPGLIWGVVAAFAGWKTIQGVAALTSSLQTISTLLGVGLPAAATTGAAGITKALGAIAIPAALLAAMAWADNQNNKAAEEHGYPVGNTDRSRVGNAPLPILPGDPMGINKKPGSGNVPGYGGGSGTFDVAPPWENPGNWQGQVRPNPARREGVAPFSLGPTAAGATPLFAVPTPTGGSGGGPKLPDAPVVPYDASVPGGSSPATFAAETSYLDARQKLAEKRARLDQLDQSAVATEQDKLKARNDVIEAERDMQGAEIRLNEARTSQFEKMTKTGDRYASQMGEIGAQLDSDFGISKGLSGIAENITKFVANLAAAPLLGQLDAIGKANPAKGGHGLMGYLGATGALGPQYTGIDYSRQAAAMGPAALQPGTYGSPGTAKPGESARDFAHRVMAPFWQNQGLTVGDHAADQYGEHQNGALDLMVNNLAEGQQVLSQVLSDPNVYGAIFNNQTYGYGQGATPRDYSGGHTGNPTQDHQDHVHALYKPGGTNNITPSSAIPGTSLAPSIPTGPSAAPSLAGVPSIPGGPLSGGIPTAAPFANTQYGGITPASGSGSGGVAIQGGAMDAAMMAAGGLDLLAPGAGQVAQTVTKLANRGIQYAGQVAGIGAQGLMETFLPFGGSELANNNWLTRIVGGLAGAAPAIPNAAGKSSQPTPDQVANVDPNTTQHGQGANPGPGNTYNTTINAGPDRSGQGIAKDWEYHTSNANSAPGM